jgi:hypothetical protein
MRECRLAQEQARRNTKGIGDCYQRCQSHVFDPSLNAPHVNCPKAGLLGQFFLGDALASTKPSNVRGDEALDLGGAGKVHLPPQLARALFLKQPL